MKRVLALFLIFSYLPSMVFGSNITPILQLLLFDENPIKIYTSQSSIPFTSVTTTFSVESTNLLTNVTIYISNNVVFSNISQENLITYKHTAIAGKSYKIVAVDNSGARKELSGKIGDSNRNPPIIKNSTIKIIENRSKNINLAHFVSDKDSNEVTTLTHRFLEVPTMISGNVSLLNTDLNISPLAEGVYIFKFSVEDANGGFDIGQLTLVVKTPELNDPGSANAFFCVDVDFINRIPYVTNNCDVGINATYGFGISDFGIGSLESWYVPVGQTQKMDYFNSPFAINRYKYCYEPYEVKVINDSLVCSITL